MRLTYGEICQKYDPDIHLAELPTFKRLWSHRVLKLGEICHSRDETFRDLVCNYLGKLILLHQEPVMLHNQLE